jgi:hypothetical protein
MDDEGTRALMNNIVKDFVRPEIERRRADGNPVDEEIWAAQVIFDSAAPSPRIRLNREVRLRAVRVGGSEFEDYVAAHEAGQRQFVALALPEDEADIRHMTMCLINVTSTWSTFFSLGDRSIQTPATGEVTFQAGYEPPPPTEWEQLYSQHNAVVEKVLAINSPTPESPIEILIATAIQRSRHLVEAYVQLAQSRNLTAASALIRMQLDSAMRVNACFLVSDPMELWEVLKSGETWNKVKSNDGRPLTDVYLHERLSEKFEWASQVYKQMSGYVHLSRPHLESTTEGEQFLGMVIHQGPAGQRVSDQELAENAQLFITVTRALLALCEEYVAIRSAG